jgi:hypothetical protein
VLIRGIAPTCAAIYWCDAVQPRLYWYLCELCVWDVKIILDNTVHYYSCNSTEKWISSSQYDLNSVYTTRFITRKEIDITSLNIHLNFISHEELTSPFLHIALFCTDNFFHEECMFVIYLHRNYYISYCLCVELGQLHLIPQVHCINNTSHNNNSYSTHTILIDHTRIEL